MYSLLEVNVAKEVMKQLMNSFLGVNEANEVMNLLTWCNG